MFYSETYDRLLPPTSSLLRDRFPAWNPVAPIGIASPLDAVIRKTARFLQTLVDLRLTRPFDPECGEQCLLLYQNDRLAEPQFSPFLRDIRRFREEGISLRAMPENVGGFDRLADSATTILYQPRFETYFTLDVDPVKRLRDRNPDAHIVFCDWFAPCDIRFAEKVDPYVDGYAKKSLMQDKRAYLQSVDGDTNLMAYYSQLFAIPVHDRARQRWTIPTTILPKLRLTPAFCTSSQLYRLFASDWTRAPARDIDVHARLQTKGSGWYGMMRQYASDAIATVPHVSRVATGMVRKHQFMAELTRSRLCFSPFGYGELCWRDFEAFAVGAVLIKPDMSHLETMGDLFRPWETYIPVAWDLSDLDSVIEAALSDDARLEAIAANAYRRVQDTLGFGATRTYLSSLLAPLPVG